MMFSALMAFVCFYWLAGLIMGKQDSSEYEMLEYHYWCDVAKDPTASQRKKNKAERKIQHYQYNF